VKVVVWWSCYAQSASSHLREERERQCLNGTCIRETVCGMDSENKAKAHGQKVHGNKVCGARGGRYKKWKVPGMLNGRGGRVWWELLGAQPSAVVTVSERRPREVMPCRPCPGCQEQAQRTRVAGRRTARRNVLPRGMLLTRLAEAR